MTHANDKKRRELAVFHEFAQRCGLSVVSGSIENRDPPEPDICCKIEGEGPVAFELVELVDRSIAEERAHVLKHPEDSGKKGLWAGEVMPILAGKFAKHYEISCPIDLICYTDGRTVLPPDVLISQMRDHLADNPNTGPFRGVWFMSTEKSEECCERVV